MKDYIRKITKDLINKELEENNIFASLKNITVDSVCEVERKVVNSLLKHLELEDYEI